MKIHVPNGVAANIHIKSGMSGLNIDTARFHQKDDSYRSDDSRLQPQKQRSLSKWVWVQ